MSALPGRNHRVRTAICLVTPKETFRQRHVGARVRGFELSDEEIEAYLASGEWRGKAGGPLRRRVLPELSWSKSSGLYSNIVGLPLYETMTLPWRRGYPIHLRRSTRYEAGARSGAVVRAPHMPMLEAQGVRSAASPPSHAFAVVLRAAAFVAVDLNRWLSGVYAEEQGQDERPCKGPR